MLGIESKDSNSHHDAEHMLQLIFSTNTDLGQFGLPWWQIDRLEKAVAKDCENLDRIALIFEVAPEATLQELLNL